MVNALIWELLALSSVTNGKVVFEFFNNTQGCLANVPMHTSEKGLLATAGRKGDNWVEAILDQVPEIRKTVCSGFALTSVRIMRKCSKHQQHNLASDLQYTSIPLISSQCPMMPMLRNNRCVQ
jgi:hypothetical protein